MDADISVIVRTHNSGKTLTKCLKEVRAQELPPPLMSEIIVVDHESTDNTVEIARRYARKVFSFTELRPNGGYTPGAALNAGAEEAEGSVLVFLSSHCFPAHKNSLAAFILAATQYAEHCAQAGIKTDMGGMYGRQLPGKNLSDLERVQLYNVFGEEWQGQAADAKFFNGYSCILGAAWKQFPFDETLETYEDRDWAQRVQAVGGKIIYTPTASVVRMVPFFHPENVAAQRRIIERPWKETQ
jgi:rhamnosyltransferase